VPVARRDALEGERRPARPSGCQAAGTKSSVRDCFCRGSRQSRGGSGAPRRAPRAGPARRPGARTRRPAPPASPQQLVLGPPDGPHPAAADHLGQAVAAGDPRRIIRHGRRRPGFSPRGNRVVISASSAIPISEPSGVPSLTSALSTSSTPAARPPLHRPRRPSPPATPPGPAPQNRHTPPGEDRRHRPSERRRPPDGYRQAS
jgi:hypothetical protein